MHLHQLPVVFERRDVWRVWISDSCTFNGSLVSVSTLSVLCHSSPCEKSAESWSPYLTSPIFDSIATSSIRNQLKPIRAARTATQKQPAMETVRWVTGWAVKEWKSLAMWFLFLFVHQITVPGTLPTTAEIERLHPPSPALCKVTSSWAPDAFSPQQLWSTCDLKERWRKEKKKIWDTPGE